MPAVNKKVICELCGEPFHYIKVERVENDRKYCDKCSLKAKTMTYKHKDRVKKDKPVMVTVDSYKTNYAKYYNMGGMFGCSIRDTLRKMIKDNNGDLMIVKALIEKDNYYQTAIKVLKTNQCCAWWHGVWDSTK